MFFKWKIILRPLFFIKRGWCENVKLIKYKSIFIFTFVLLLNSLNDTMRTYDLVRGSFVHMKKKNYLSPI